MDRYAIFVDAGYFFAAGAQAAFGNHTPRKQVILKSPEAMLADLCARASAAAANLPLLRAYWYDAMPGPRLSMEQSALAMLPGVKLRLGALNNAGEQKGVDSLIVTDLIDLARNRAIADAVVVTGDEDLRIAVQVAPTTSSEKRWKASRLNNWRSWFCIFRLKQLFPQSMTAL